MTRTEIDALHELNRTPEQLAEIRERLAANGVTPPPERTAHSGADNSTMGPRTDTSQINEKRLQPQTDSQAQAETLGVIQNEIDAITEQIPSRRSEAMRKAWETRRKAAETPAVLASQHEIAAGITADQAAELKRKIGRVFNCHMERVLADQALEKAKEQVSRAHALIADAERDRNAFIDSLVRG